MLPAFGNEFYYITQHFISSFLIKENPAFHRQWSVEKRYTSRALDMSREIEIDCLTFDSNSINFFAPLHHIQIFFLSRFDSRQKFAIKIKFCCFRLSIYGRDLLTTRDEWDHFAHACLNLHTKAKCFESFNSCFVGIRAHETKANINLSFRCHKIVIALADKITSDASVLETYQTKVDFCKKPLWL